MKSWPAFYPSPSNLYRLLGVSPQVVLGGKPGSPFHGVFFLRDSGDERFAISWSYGEVEFKFEVYFLQVRDDLESSIDSLECVAEIPPHESVECFFLTTWLRAAVPGEVPDNYEQVVQESGSIANVPASAVAVATSLFGIGFSDANGSVLMGFAIDISKSYCLRVVANEPELSSIFSDCDRVTATAIEPWLQSIVNRSPGQNVPSR